jgi:hypothetical protein
LQCRFLQSRHENGGLRCLNSAMIAPWFGHWPACGALESPS